MKTNLFDRTLDQFVDCFDREAAQKLADFQLDDESQARIAELNEKANLGLLTDEERSEHATAQIAMALYAKFRQRVARQM